MDFVVYCKKLYLLSMKQIFFTFILILTFCVFSFAQNEKSACPTIKVIGPSSITIVNEPAFFTVELGDEAKKFNVQYEWNVERGEIAGGQGTSQISVLPKIEGANLKATIKIKGLPENCSNTESELAGISQKIPECPADNYGKIPLEDELARLDSLMANLMQDSESQAFIILYRDESESFDQTKKHIQKLINHMKFRKFPKERITFALNKTDFYSTVVYIMLDKTKTPECIDCKIIKFNDL